MKRRDKPHPPLSSLTDLSIPDNRRLANLQENNDKMTYIDFHFPTLSQQPNSLNDFLLSHSTPEPQLALPIIDTGSRMSLPSRQAKVLPDSQRSGSNERIYAFVQNLTRIIDAFIPKLNISFELKKHKDNSFELRFKVRSK